MYFLLDTNIYLHLLSETESERPLRQLEEIVFTGRVQLLVPEIINEEWQSKKEQTFKAHRDETNSGKRSRNAFTFGPVRRLQILKDRAERIDRLLLQGVRIKLLGKTKQVIYDRMRYNLPPYHQPGKKVHRDAGFFFSAMEYIQKKNITEVWFVTNDDGFSAPGGTIAIHPELCPAGCTLHYHTSIEWCLSQLKDPLQLNTQDANPSKEQYIVYMGSHHRDLLDELHYVTKSMHETLPFVPTDLLCRLHPFRINTGIGFPYAYYTDNTLHTNNKNLATFFSHVSFGNKARFKKSASYANTKGNLEKLNDIVTALNNNLVFSIVHQRPDIEVDIRIQDSKSCSCMICCLSRLDFLGVFRASKEAASDNTFVEAGKAWIFNELNAYPEAFRLYHRLYKESVAQGKHAVAYRMQFCLKWVNNLIHFDPVNLREIKQETDNFNLTESFYEFASAPPFQREVAEILYEGKIFDSYALKIKKILDSIRDHYRLQLGAGYSNNAHLTQLISAYQELEMYVTLNGLPFTRFSEYRQLTDHYVEGLMISASLNANQVERLENMHENMLMQLLLHAMPESLIKHYKHYNRDPLPHTWVKGNRFERSVKTFLRQHKEVLGGIEHFSEFKHQVRGNYTRYFWNMLILLSVVEFPESFIKECLYPILDVISTLGENNRMDIKYLRTFMGKHKKLLGGKWMEKLFAILTESPYLIQHELISIMGSFNRDSTAPLIREMSQYDKVLYWLKSQREVQATLNEYSRFDFFRMMSKPLKKKFAKDLLLSLEEQFEHRKFYGACLYDVIPTAEYLPKFLDRYKRPQQIEENPFIGSSEKVMPNLDDLIYLSAIKSVPLPETFLNQFRGISPYYDWLTDMKGFDYAAFDPLWLIQCDVSHLLKQAFAVPELREGTRQYLSRQNQPVLARMFALYGTN